MTDLPELGVGAESVTKGFFSARRHPPPSCCDPELLPPVILEVFRPEGKQTQLIGALIGSTAIEPARVLHYKGYGILNNNPGDIMTLRIDDADYQEIATLIHSDTSPVGIDAKKTHILILSTLQRIEARLERIEAKLDTQSADE